MRNFVYLIVDRESRSALLVDCQKDLKPVFDWLALHRITLSGVLLTHSHHDHVAGLSELLAANKDLSVHLHEAEYHRIGKKIGRERCIFIEEDALISLGGIAVDVLHTPGHSAGGLCFLVQGGDRGYLLTGDTLFIRDCGRTDLETGSVSDMFKSLMRLKTLSPDTVILPGHHYAVEETSILSAELEQNAALKVRSVKELEQLP